MSIFSNLFRKKEIIKEIPGLGEFTYYKDAEDEYWKRESPVGMFSDKFNFGAITGNIDGPSLDALFVFKKYANNPDELASYISKLFLDELLDEFGALTVEEVKSKFYLKSLTCTSKNEFEFGYHSWEGDVFVESFYRNGTVTEVYLDKGCCEHI